MNVYLEFWHWKVNQLIHDFSKPPGSFRKDPGQQIAKQFDMKAAVRTKYGLPGDLSIKELDVPTPKDDEVLIRVHATTVNRSDCHVLSGRPFFMRLLTGLFNPGHRSSGQTLRGKLKRLVPPCDLLKPVTRSWASEVLWVAEPMRNILF